LGFFCLFGRRGGCGGGGVGLPKKTSPPGCPPGGDPRGATFIRVADTPFDDNHRLLAYAAPDYSTKERREIPKEGLPDRCFAQIPLSSNPLVTSIDEHRNLSEVK
jgi:hypothetical protein